MSDKTKDSIDIRWQESSFDGNSPVQNFSVTILKDGEVFDCATSPSRDDTSCIFAKPSATFSNLVPFTTYNFTICSINSIGKTCTDGTFGVKTSEDGLLCFLFFRAWTCNMLGPPWRSG